MGGISVWQILIIVAVVVVLFGRGKISSIMGDVAHGIKSFKKGIADEEPEQETAQISEKESEKVASNDKKDTADKS